MLRVGVIGCGGMGRDHIRRLTEKIQGAEVVAVSDVFEESARKAAEICGAKVYADSKELINAENVDAVFIVSPGFAHVDSLLQAIEAAKRIFCEKPLCTTAEDCLKVVKAEEAAGKHLIQCSGCILSFKFGCCKDAVQIYLLQIMILRVGEVEVIIMTGDEGNTDGFSISSKNEVTGVLVAAQGAGSAVTVQNIQQAIMALFQIDAHKIRVMKMK